MRRLLAVLVVLAALAATVAAPAPASPACDRFAAASGDDAAAATSEHPVRTVSALMAGLAPGQVGCLRPGDQFPTVAFLRRSGTPQAPIELTSGPGPGRAVLTGQLAFEGSHTRIRGLRFAGLGGIAATSPKTSHLLINGDDVQLLDNDITSPKGICVDAGDIGGYAPDTVENGSTIQRADDLVIAGNRIHDCGVQNFLDGDFTSQDSGIHGVYLVNTRRAVIRDNLITGVIDRGIQLWPRNEDALIEHNTLDGNGSNVNIGSSAAYGHFASGTVVRDNLITNALMRSGTTPNFPVGDDAQVVGFFPDDVDRGNRVVDNCLFGDFSPEFDFLGRGFSASGNLREDPQYVDRRAGDFRLRAGSPCAGKGVRVVAESPVPAAAPSRAAETPTAAAPLRAEQPTAAKPPPPARCQPDEQAMRVRVLGVTLRGAPERQGLRLRVSAAGSCASRLAAFLSGRLVAGRVVRRAAGGSQLLLLRFTRAGWRRVAARRADHLTLVVRSGGDVVRQDVALPSRRSRAR